MSNTRDRQTVIDLLTAASRIERGLDQAVSNIKGISFGEYRLLSALRAQPGAAASRVDLAGLVGRSPSGVTRALQPLEKLGFVTTTRNRRDARQALATLTEQGTQLVDDATGVLDDAIGELVSRLPNNQLERTAAVLEGFRHA